jgi:NitT/TauT family transport system permease protein
VVLWVDTAASLKRLLTGVAISMGIGLVFGVLTGLIPYVQRTLSPLTKVLSMIPPLAVLPILFIALGVDELSKIVLIVFGIAPCIARDVQQRVEELPPELLIKAQTLGASTWQLILRIVLPQTVPRLLDATRLALGSAWLFLIAAEAIAATEGLGYRIFLVRRFLDMDVILPYVAWITLLAFALDFLLRLINRVVFPWYGAGAVR